MHPLRIPRFLTICVVLALALPAAHPRAAYAQPGSGGRIAFVTDRDGNWEIYVMNADGSGLQNLSNSPAMDISPVWSPDGQRLVFSSNRDGNFELYAIGGDGRGLTRLTNTRADEVGGSWSPDGLRFVFAVYEDEEYLKLCIAETDGSGMVCPTNDIIAGADYVMWPDWSPDGSRIAFHVESWYDEDIYAMSPDGSQVWDLSQNGAAEDDRAPYWSPDGTRIAFWSERGGGELRIYVMNADGSGQRPLTQGDPEVAGPYWSPDGERLAIVLERGGTRDIFVVNPDGTGLARLTDNPADDWGPTWSPAGDRIAFVSTRDGNPEIYVMNADGSGQVRLLAHPASEGSLAWSPAAAGASMQAPVIETPADATRALSCVVDVAGTAEPGSELKLINAARDLELDPEGNLLWSPEPVWTLAVGEDGTWAVAGLSLRRGIVNNLVAKATNAEGLSRVSSRVQVNCTGPQVVAYSPEDGTELISTDLSEGEVITFRFDVPMDDASINGWTVRLVSESLEEVQGEISKRPGEGSEEPVYIFTPYTYLKPGTRYSVLLGSGIQAAAPDQDVHLVAFAWDIQTPGAPREKLVEAIRHLAERAERKILSDLRVATRMYEDVKDIEESLRVLDALKLVINLTGQIASLLSDLPESVTQLFYRETLEEALVDVATLGLFLDSLGEAYSLAEGPGWPPPLDDSPLFSAEDARLIEEALKIEDPSARDRETTTELQDTLLGAGRAPALHIAWLGNQLPRRRVGTFNGAQQAIDRIHQAAELVIQNLPDTLPPDFDGEACVEQLYATARALTRSRLEDVTHSYQAYVITEEGQGQLSMEEIDLGAIAQQSRIFQRLLAQQRKRSKADMRLTLAKLATNSFSAIMVLSGPGFKIVSELAVIPEAIVLGEEVNHPLPPDPRKLIVQMPGSTLALLAEEISKTHRVSEELLAAVGMQALGMQAPEPGGLAGLFRPEPAYAAELPPRPALSLSECALGDVVTEEGRVAGQGSGSCLVSNEGDGPWSVRAVVELQPLLPPGGEPFRAGRGESLAPVVVEPGGTGRLELELNALGPAFTGQADLQAMVYVIATPPEGGWSWRLGPWTSDLRTGTPEQLGALAPIPVEPLLSGELAVAQVHTTTLTLPEAGRASLQLTYQPALTIGLTLEGAAGEILEFDGLSGPARIPGQGVSHEVGSGYQHVVVEAAAGETLTVTVRGIVSRAGHGERYQLNLIRDAARPALLAAFPPHLVVNASSPPVGFQLFAQEIGGQREITQLAVTASPLVSAAGQSIGSDGISLQLDSDSIQAGATASLEGTILIPPDLAAGAYGGSVLIQALDAVDGRELMVEVPVTLQWEPAAVATAEPPQPTETAPSTEPLPTEVAAATPSPPMEEIEPPIALPSPTPEAGDAEPGTNWLPWLLAGGVVGVLLGVALYVWGNRRK